LLEINDDERTKTQIQTISQEPNKNHTLHPVFKGLEGPSFWASNVATHLVLGFDQLNVFRVWLRGRRVDPQRAVREVVRQPRPPL
jgi:hypothetical protein